MLECLALSGKAELLIQGKHELDMMYLVRDGLLVLDREFGTGRTAAGGSITKLDGKIEGEQAHTLPLFPRSQLPDRFDTGAYRLTEAGRRFVTHWLTSSDPL